MVKGEGGGLGRVKSSSFSFHYSLENEKNLKDLDEEVRLKCLWMVYFILFYFLLLVFIKLSYFLKTGRK